MYLCRLRYDIFQQLLVLCINFIVSFVSRSVGIKLDVGFSLVNSRQVITPACMPISICAGCLQHRMTICPHQCRSPCRALLGSIEQSDLGIEDIGKDLSKLWRLRNASTQNQFSSRISLICQNITSQLQIEDGAENCRFDSVASRCVGGIQTIETSRPGLGHIQTWLVVHKRQS